MEAANGGTLEVQVHSDNAYSFTGIADDIAKGPQAVDTDQMRQAYELLADAADWAADDAVNSILVADPALQELHRLTCWEATIWLCSVSTLHQRGRRLGSNLRKASPNASANSE